MSVQISLFAMVNLHCVCSGWYDWLGSVFE